MIILSSTTSIMTMSTNATLLSLPTTEHIYLSSYYTSMIKRLLIVFGSIFFLWLIMGLVFASIQTFRHIKKKTNNKFFRYNRSLPPSSLITPTRPPYRRDNNSDNDEDDDDDDQASVFTSVSYLSERSRNIHDSTQFAAPCQRIPEEEFELTLPMTAAGISNMAFSRSTLASSTSGGASLLYYPACRNFAYSQSTLASSTADLNTPTPSIIVPTNEPSTYKARSSRLANLKRHSSQSSSTTTFSQITNATYLSSSSTSTSSSIPIASLKRAPLPTVMITDCDRLQTDIIELDDFEPEKDWRRAQPELRLLLNDKMPQAVR
ncbi:unnamed protein product [Adineta steineri]|uniref:Uncharacterized protein n=1 Tax=Adineta steineri TaxID=433720 RepID=A0A815MZJ6_9BILA|nr:unnamed protein product [Adineta steineri]